MADKESTKNQIIFNRSDLSEEQITILEYLHGLSERKAGSGATSRLKQERDILLNALEIIAEIDVPVRNLNEAVNSSDPEENEAIWNYALVAKNALQQIKSAKNDKSTN